MCKSALLHLWHEFTEMLRQKKEELVSILKDGDGRRVNDRYHSGKSSRCLLLAEPMVELCGLLLLLPEPQHE